MAVITHHHHTVISTPVYDDDTGMWKSRAWVSWPNKENTRGVRFLTSSPELVFRFEDAEQAGLEAGKNSVESGHKKVNAA